jgi:molybdate transport system ATP-binding protein
MLEHGRVAARGSVTALTAANALPGVATYREPAVVLDARVSAQEAARQLSVVTAGELSLLVPEVDVAVNTRVRVQIPAHEVILATTPPTGLSLHNVVGARVRAVREAGQAGQRLVELEVGSTPLLALVTADAVRNLAIANGRELLALIKAVAVDVFA